MPRTHSLLALALLVCPACAVEDDEASLRFLPDTTGNTGGGTVFNTNQMDQIGFSELTPATDDTLTLVNDPSMMPGFTLTSLVLDDGSPLAGFSAVDGEIVGIGASQSEHKGAALLESAWTIDHATLSDPKTMWLTQIVAPVGEIPRYRFTYWHHKALHPTCPNGQTGPGVARLLTGFSLHEKSGKVKNAPQTTYFACDTGATGKAADLGFYDLVADGATNDAAWNPFEVAIRVIRADYCYDGTSFTTPGTAVVIEDKWGVMPAPPVVDQNATIEAVWGAHGLICRGQGRHADVKCDDPVPPCSAKDLENYGPDALFLTRVPAVSKVDLPPGDTLPIEPPSPL